MMSFHRTTSKLALKLWDEKFLTFLEISPSLEGASKGQPKAGEKRFDYDKSIRISFNAQEMLLASFHLLGLSYNDEAAKYEKYADLSKVAGSTSTDKKKLTVQKNSKGDGISFNMNQGDKSVYITLSHAEVYAIAKWFEIQATRYLMDKGSHGKMEEASHE